MGIEVQGANELAADLRELDGRIERPRLEESARRLRELLEGNIKTQRLGTFPPLRRSTVRQRLRLGYPAGPPLLRSRAMLRSIAVVREGSGFVEVGPTVSYAGPANSPRPFVGVAAADVDHVVEPILEGLEL